MPLISLDSISQSFWGPRERRHWMSRSATEQDSAKSRGQPKGLAEAVERAGEDRGGVAAAAWGGYRAR